MPTLARLTIIQGDTLTKPFRSRVSGVVIDYANYSVTVATLDVAEYFGGPSVLAEPLTTTNGGIVLGKYTDTQGKEWSGYVYMSAADTAALTEWGDGVWDLVIGDGAGWTKTLFRGTAVLDPEVSIT